MGIAKQLQTVDEAFAKITAVPELANKPLIIGENDPEGCAACPGPQNAYRNGTMYSSYTAASYARIWELARQRHAHLEGALTWAFTFVGQPWFAGYRQLATRDVDLPVLNVFRLFARLGADQIEANSSRELPLMEIIAEGVRETPDVGVLATRAEGGRIDVLLWHYRDDDVSSPAAEILLKISGAAVRGSQIRAWRVDEAHANAAAWALSERSIDLGTTIARSGRRTHRNRTAALVGTAGPCRTSNGFRQERHSPSLLLHRHATKDGDTP
jgi:xylan 1,4-beta-xylosidase